MSSKEDYLRAVTIKEENKDVLMTYPNVVSVGVGKKNDTDEICISVGVSEKVPEGRLAKVDTIPSQVGGVEGVTTDVLELGYIVPEVLHLLKPQRRGKFRPVPQGVSIGHPDITAGSTGWMYKNSDGTVYIGSNNHVLANSNQANIGDSIIQPGSADGGSTPGSDIGTLEYYSDIEDGVNVDLALAEITVEHDNFLVDVDKPITGVAGDISVGDTLVKSGRTTGVLRADIQQLDASVNVNYGGDLGTVTIESCIITGSMSDGGDSGSPSAKEVDGELRAAGRVFAGSDSATVHHNISSELAHIKSYDDSLELLTDGGDNMSTVQVTLTLTEEEPDMGNVEATVEDDSGELVEDATVSIEGPTTDSKSTGSNGVATFNDIVIGDYTVSADKDGYGTDSTTVEAGQFG